MPDRKDVRADNPRYKDHPEFTPDLSPKRMADLGVFDGDYWHDASDDDREDIPAAIIAKLDQPSDPKRNMFKIHSGLNIEQWRSRGWIRDQDPLGWYQWYVRFHGGRRTDDDARQIARWMDFRNRWTPGSRKALENMNPGPKTRQALLHWALNPWRPEECVEAGERDEAKAA